LNFNGIPKKLNSIEHEFKYSYLENFEKIVPDQLEREDKLRVSGFPYCGLQHLYKRLIKHKNPQTYLSKYYTDVGTATHTVLQANLGHTRRMYGMWKCHTPKCKGINKISKSNVCPRCKKVMEYVELEVKAFNHLSGHLDGLYKDRQGKYWVIDYKTCSSAIINDGRKLPYKKNVAQISGYCALLELELDIKIEGWILVYVSRDNPRIVLPISRVTTKKFKSNTLNTIRTYDKHYGIVMNAKRFEDVEVLIKEKPCKTEKFYKEVYCDAFSKCPLAEVCFSPKKLEAKLKKAWDNKDKDWLEHKRPDYLKTVNTV